MPNRIKLSIIAAMYSILSVGLQTVYAETATPSITKSQKIDIENISKKWKCKYCPDNSKNPWYLDLNTGFAYVTNDSYKFGEYNGLYKKGTFFIFDIDAMYRDNEGFYFGAIGENLGLDTRILELEAGRQGRYKINILLDQINQYKLDTSQTPYSGNNSQTLPNGFVKGLTTLDMISLNSDIHDINYFTERKNFEIGGEIIQNSTWSYDMRFKRYTNNGKTPFSATIGSNFADAKSAILARPIDYTTNQIELAANFTIENFAGRILFNNSSFKNNNRALQWENAFTTIDTGQSALEPNNNMQQLLFSGNYHGIKNVLLNGLISVTRMTQNENFLSYTINSTLPTTPLPRKSLNGEVMAYNANFVAHWSLTPDTRLNFIYEHQEQDNKTPIENYSYVTADTTVSGNSRTNVPYDFRIQKIKINTDHNFTQQLKISGGAQFTKTNRSYQEVAETRENKLWAKFTDKINADLNFSIKTELTDRTTNEYKILSEVNPPENPLLRKYNLANRNGIKNIANLTYFASQKILLNFNIDQSSYNYSDSTVGLTKSNDLSAGIDIQYVPTNGFSLTGFIQQSNISSDQVGSSTVTTADWSASNDDIFITAGIGGNYILIDDELSIGVDYVHAEGKSEISITALAATPLPDLTSNRDTITLHGKYTVNENMLIKLSYQYESYKEENWSLDGVTPNTMSNVLATGEVSPDYNIGVFWLTMKYSF